MWTCAERVFKQSQQQVQQAAVGGACTWSALGIGGTERSGERGKLGSRRGG